MTAFALSPIELNSQLPYRIELRPYSMDAAEVPTLHSFAVGEYDGKWLFVSGRTNGMHGFDVLEPEVNFPVEHQNRDVWVVDIASRQTWRRSLDDPSAGLTQFQKLALSTTNNQFYHSNEMLYVTGGYGQLENGNFGTFDTLTAIDMPGLGDWVVNGNGSAATHIRQIRDPLLQVTGGTMHPIGGRTHLVFGHDYQGFYLPYIDGIYTEQVRSFDIVDDGTNLSIENTFATEPNENFRRRDLNVYPVIRRNGGSLEQGLTALSGVFTLDGDAWTVPVEIDAAGEPTTKDPSDPTAFHQGMNNYYSAKVGFFSEATGEMHEVLFGGITLQYLNPTTQMIEEDPNLPFVNDITSVITDSEGDYSQHHLGFFPELLDMSGATVRFGTNSEFLPADGLPIYENGVLKFDELGTRTSLGHIFGGIITNAPHTRGVPGAVSSASNHFFEVILIRVPEPSSLVMAAVLAIILPVRRRHHPGDRSSRFHR